MTCWRSKPPQVTKTSGEATDSSLSDTTLVLFPPPLLPISSTILVLRSSILFSSSCLDRNLGNEVVAQEQFKQLSTAYSILKDPIQRRYYDSHREMILSGSHPDSADHEDDNDVNSFAATSFSFDDLNSSPPTPILLQRYLWRCYDQYDDSPTGFYSVYSSLFQYILSSELDHYHALQSSSNSAIGSQKEKKLHEKLLNLTSFGNSQSSTDEVLSFYQTWREFSTILSFEWTDLTSEEIFDYYSTMLDPMTAAAAVSTSASDEVLFNKSHRKHVIKEYNHRIQEILDFLEQIDNRFQKSIQEKKLQQKELKKFHRRKKYFENEASGASDELNEQGNIEKETEEEKKKIEEWALKRLTDLQFFVRYGSDEMTPVLPGSTGTSSQTVDDNQVTKAEKEKLKKSQSKIRNIFRKLMKLVLSEYLMTNSASGSSISVGDEIASIVEVQGYLDELHSILDRMIAYTPLESIQEINQRLGGESSLKDNSIGNHLGEGISLFRHLYSLTTQYEQQTSLFLTREKMINKLISARSSTVTSPNLTHKNRWKDCEWTERERLIILSIYQSFVSPYLENTTTSSEDIFFIPNRQLSLRSFWQYLVITINYFLWICPTTSANSGDMTQGFDFSVVNSTPVALPGIDLTQVARDAYLYSEEEIMRALYHLVGKI